MMIQTFIEKQIAAQEAMLGAPLDYLRHMAKTSLPAFFKFSLFTPLARHQRVVPPSVLMVAHLVASQAQDCGTCVQIAVNLARQHGVSPEVIRTVLADHPNALPDDLRDVYDFSRVVVTQAPEDEVLRERLRERFGEEGLIELALALATAQVFPIVKRGLGYAKSCALVELEMAA